MVLSNREWNDAVDRAIQKCDDAMALDHQQIANTGNLLAVHFFR